MFYWVEWCSHRTSEYDPIWKYGLCRCRQDRPYWLRVGSKSNDWHLYKKNERGIWIQTEKHTWKKGWTDVSRRLRKAEDGRQPLGVGRGKERFFSRDFSGNMTRETTCFQVSDLQTCEKIHSCCFKPLHFCHPIMAVLENDYNLLTPTSRVATHLDLCLLSGKNDHWYLSPFSKVSPFGW